MDWVQTCATAVTDLEHASVQQSQVLHPVVHGLQNLLFVSVEHVGLSPHTDGALRVTSKGEEGSELVPSEAKFLIEDGICARLVTTNVSSRERHAKHLRSKDTCKTKVERVPGSFVVGVRLSWGILASASKAASCKDEGTVVVVFLSSILSCLHHTVSIKRMSVILLHSFSIQIVS